MRYKKKKNYLGVIMFTTELYKQFLVPAKVVVEGCVKILFNKIYTDRDFSFVEPMHKLLTNIGAQLEGDSAMHKTLTIGDKKIPYKEYMEIVYRQLKVVKDDPSMGKRDRFKIEDILELRQNWIRDVIRSKSSVPSSTTPVRTRSIVLKAPSKEVTADSVKNLIYSTIDEFMANKNAASVYEYFTNEVIKTGYSYLLIPSLFQYCLEKNSSIKDVEIISSLLCDFSAFISSDHKDLAKGIETLLTILGDVEDATETVISQFATFMSSVLSRLNFSVTAEFVKCLTNLKEDYDPFCSWKEKKKYGASALYFVSTLSMVYKHNPEQAKVMLSNAEGCSELFFNEEQRKNLYDMYGLSSL